VPLTVLHCLISLALEKIQIKVLIAVLQKAGFFHNHWQRPHGNLHPDDNANRYKNLTTFKQNICNLLSIVCKSLLFILYVVRYF
jgi:hypothetical protein